MNFNHKSKQIPLAPRAGAGSPGRTFESDWTTKDGYSDLLIDVATEYLKKNAQIINGEVHITPPLEIQRNPFLRELWEREANNLLALPPAEQNLVFQKAEAKLRPLPQPAVPQPYYHQPHIPEQIIAAPIDSLQPVYTDAASSSIQPQKKTGRTGLVAALIAGSATITFVSCLGVSKILGNKEKYNGYIQVIGTEGQQNTIGPLAHPNQTGCFGVSSKHKYGIRFEGIAMQIDTPTHDALKPVIPKIDRIEGNKILIAPGVPVTVCKTQQSR